MKFAPLLYRVADLRNGLVHEHYVNGGWKLHCRRRNLRTGEAMEMNDLMIFLNAKSLNLETNSWEWKWNKEKAFSVKSFYNVLLKSHKEYAWQALIGHLTRAGTILATESVKLFLMNWPSLNSRGFGEVIWDILPFAALWVIWNHRNPLISEQESVEVTKVERHIKNIVWAWLDAEWNYRSWKKEHKFS
ncbi:hypothetical protein FRX31_034156 [Thalictrum thalictroides]|uniref:Uncharacterized protein n=1 Tax=Thalictrum thalictroides TaxID=46969 RepID=A0A7J6UUK3_THATH|nr:hypothetical protein FRX31_034156 [Thalictrum thalictroides]